MKSTLSILSVTNTSKRSVDSSKQSIKSFVKFMRIYERKIESIEFPSKRQMKAVANLNFSPKQNPDGSVDVPVPQFTIPNWLVGLSVGTTLFTAPAWLPDALQKHLGLNLINKQESETYKAEGTRTEKLNRLLKEKQGLSWWDWVTGRAQEIDEQINFVQTGRTKAYTFNGKGTTPTTPTFSENDPNWQGTIGTGSIAQKQESEEFKKRYFDQKLNVELFSRSVDKFEKVYFGESAATASSSPSMQQASDMGIPPRDPSGPPVENQVDADYIVSGGELPSKYVNTPDYGEKRSQGHNHQGEDYPIAQGTPVSMVVPGTVAQAGFSAGAAGGNILITHEDGKQTRYLHMSAINVKPGDRVVSGQVIGLTGGEPGTRGAGRSTGPHLHLEYYETTTSYWSDPKPHADKYFRFGGNVKVKPKPKTGGSKPTATTPFLGSQQQQPTAVLAAGTNNYDDPNKAAQDLKASIDELQKKGYKVVVVPPADKGVYAPVAKAVEDVAIASGATVEKGMYDPNDPTRAYTHLDPNEAKRIKEKYPDAMIMGDSNAARIAGDRGLQGVRKEGAGTDEILGFVKALQQIGTPQISGPRNVPMPPAQYPTYNRSNRGSQNNIMITPISTGSKSKPIILTSGGGQQSMPDVGPVPPSMSDFATAVLLTQLSGS